MHVDWTTGEWVIQQQDARNHIALYHGACDAAVRDEVLYRLLFPFGCHILDYFEPFVRHLRNMNTVVMKKIS